MICVAAMMGCGNRQENAAEALLVRAKQQFEQREYVQALFTIDSLRKAYPNAFDTRRQALKLYQDIELKRSQEELEYVDSVVQVASSDYSQLKTEVEAHKAALCATAEELTALTRAKVRLDSLRTRHEALCAKIRFIHKKQGED